MPDQQLRFEFVDGSAELVRYGSPRYWELIGDGHTPVDTLPGSDGVSDSLEAYLAARFGVQVDTTDAAVADVLQSGTESPGVVQGVVADAVAPVEARVDTAESELSGRLSAVTLAATFGRKRALDVRDFGAVCDGVADDTAAIQAAIDAAGDNGTVELPALSMKITAPLVLQDGTELRGVGTKPSRLMVSSDIAAITASGGQGQAIRNVKVWSTFAGTRTTYDIDVTNPTKTVLEDVEVDLPTSVTGLGGIRFKLDSGLPGNAFMPMLSRVWIRQGTLMIDNVTDGHFVDGFVWAGDAATAAIHNVGGHLWTFASVDVVPSDGAGAGYLFDSVEGAQITGGYIDGSYTDNITGYGIRAVNSHRILGAAVHFYHNGRSGIQLESSHACSFSSCGFQRGNKQNAAHPDINLVDSDYNTFLGTVHSQPVDRTNKGGVYREDAASLHNTIDYASIDLSVGNFYTTPFVGNKGAAGGNNRPASLWAAHAGAPDLIFPPAALLSVPAAVAWPTANMAIFHRFTVSRGGSYRYANFRCDAGSGNVQAAVVSLSGTAHTSYTRVMDSGIIACTSGDKLLDMSNVFLAPGEYALVLWCDNTTATFRVQSNTGLTATRTTAEVSSLTGGIPASGSIGANWGATRAIGGLSLGLSV